MNRLLFGAAFSVLLFGCAPPNPPQPAQPIAQLKPGVGQDPNYDPTGKVDRAAGQMRSGYTMTTTDCPTRDSGTSNCGHEYGIWLTPDRPRTPLEHLKTL